MSEKKPPENAPLLSEKPLAEQIGYFSVLLENVQTQIKVIAEGQEQLRHDLNEKIEGVEERLSAEIQITQQALKAVKDDLKTDIKYFRDETKLNFKGIDRDIDHVRTSLNTTISGVEWRLSSKIDKVTEKVDEHDTDITLLKTAAAPAG